MDAFINVNKKGPQIRIKIYNILDRYNRLPYNYQSKLGYDTVIQNIILNELTNVMGTTTTDMDIELKSKIIRIKYLEGKRNIII